MFFLSFPFVGLCNSPSPASVVWQEITPICRLKSATSNQDDAGPTPLIPPSLGVGGKIPVNTTAAQQIIPVTKWVTVSSSVSVMLKAVWNIPLSVPITAQYAVCRSEDEKSVWKKIYSKIYLWIPLSTKIVFYLCGGCFKKLLNNNYTGWFKKMDSVS